jgi:hypothetical protein
VFSDGGGESAGDAGVCAEADGGEVEGALRGESEASVSSLLFSSVRLR